MQATLEHLSKDALCKLHKAVGDKASAMFPAYKDRKPVSRREKHTLAPDIAILGYSICNGSPLRDMERAFQRPSTSLDTQEQPSVSDHISEIQHLLEIVTSLKDRVDALEKEVEALKTQATETSGVAPTCQRGSHGMSDSDNEGRTTDLKIIWETQRLKRRRKSRNHHNPGS